MDSDLEMVLMNCDDPEATEAPEDFDLMKSLGKVEKLKPKLEEIVEGTLVLIAKIENASFFAEFRFESMCIRFSTFSGLCTMWTTEEMWPVDVVKRGKMTDAFLEAGFVYVPAAPLEHEYTGENRKMRDTSWWIRYFDYH